MVVFALNSNPCYLKLGGQMLVTFIESSEIRIAKFISESELAKTLGVCTSSCSRAFWINLLKKNPEYKRSWFMQLLGGFSNKITNSHINMGCLYFNDSMKWSLLAYGREGIDTLKIIAKELSLEFCVNIEIELVSEESKFEHIPD
jgi:hypothetical protein